MISNPECYDSVPVTNIKCIMMFGINPAHKSSNHAQAHENEYFSLTASSKLATVT